MANEEIRQELEALKAQVAALAAARESATEEEPPEAPSSHLNEELSRGFDELVDLLDREFRNHPTAAAAAVFALGVLVGRGLR